MVLALLLWTVASGHGHLKNPEDFCGPVVFHEHVQIEVDVRGRIVTTELVKRSRELDSKDVMNGFIALAEDWSHSARCAREEDRPSAGPLLVVETIPRTKEYPERTYAVVDDAEWFAGILHMVRARTRERGAGVSLNATTRRDLENLGEGAFASPPR